VGLRRPWPHGGKRQAQGACHVIGTVCCDPAVDIAASTPESMVLISRIARSGERGMPNIPYHPDSQSLFHPEASATLFAAGCTPSNVPLGIECARLAYMRAENGGADATTLTAALAAAGFGAPQLFADPDPNPVTNTGARGYATTRPDGSAVIAFRGTQPDSFQNILTDVRFVPTNWPESGGMVHSGFAQGLRSVRTQLDGWVAATGTNASQLLICGHSLGAALATLAASIFQPAQLITLGSPRVGDGDFAATLHGVDATRLVDCCDIVTHLPPESSSYTHVGDLRYIDRDGDLSHAPGELTMCLDQTQARLAYAVGPALTPGNVPSRDLADHAPINYARAFF